MIWKETWNWKNVEMISESNKYATAYNSGLARFGFCS